MKKRILSLVLVLGLVFSMTGCGSDIGKAESAVKGMFSALKDVDFEKAGKYANIDDFGSMGDSELTENIEVVMETILDKLDYKIISSEQTDENTVIVKTEVTTTDMKPVVTDFFTEAFTYALSIAFKNPQPTEEETNKKMEEILVECASKPDLETVTNEIDIKVAKDENGEWKVDADETVVDTLLGGFVSAAKQMSDSLGGSEE